MPTAALPSIPSAGEQNIKRAGIVLFMILPDLHRRKSNVQIRNH